MSNLLIFWRAKFPNCRTSIGTSTILLKQEDGSSFAGAELPEGYQWFSKPFGGRKRDNSIHSGMTGLFPLWPAETQLSSNQLKISRITLSSQSNKLLNWVLAKMIWWLEVLREGKLHGWSALSGSRPNSQKENPTSFMETLIKFWLKMLKDQSSSLKAIK